MDTLARVRHVFEECFGDARLQRFGDEAVPFTDFPSHHMAADLDSLDHVEFVMALEDEFGTFIPDDAAEQIGSIANAVGVVDELTRQPATV